MHLLLFKASKGNWLDKLYAHMTGGLYSQAQIEFSDGLIFGINTKDCKPIFHLANYHNYENWIRIPLPLNEEKVRDWCENFEETGELCHRSSVQWIYDSFTLHKFYSRKLGCKVVSAALKAADYDGIPDRPSANDLYEWSKWWSRHHPSPFTTKPIVSLTVEPTQSYAGDPVTVTWKTQFADRVTLDEERVEPNGSIVLHPKHSKIIILFAENCTGMSSEVDIIIVHKQPYYSSNTKKRIAETLFWE